MRISLYDEEGILLRKFWDKATAERYMIPGYTMTINPLERRRKPTMQELINLVGEALF